MCKASSSLTLVHCHQHLHLLPVHHSMYREQMQSFLQPNPMSALAPAFYLARPTLIQGEIRLSISGILS